MKKSEILRFNGTMKKTCLPIVIAIMFLTISGTSICAGFPDSSINLTSITLDTEDATGNTTNAPGVWSTNTADIFSQVGVMNETGFFLNTGSEPGNLGEISIPLKPGINTFTLIGNGIFPVNAYYGAILFLDGIATPPQVAVYNANGNIGNFLVQPEGATVIGSANGGLFFDQAPGTSVYIAPDGTKVEVLSFVINSMSSNIDKISFAYIGPDGNPDTTAQLILRVTPPPPPISITTDKPRYLPGDTMIVKLDISNPTINPVAFEWYIGLPQSGKWVTEAKVSIPAGYNETRKIMIPVGNWGSSPLGLVHYVHLLDPVTKEVLAQDAAVFSYSPGLALSTQQVDITEEIRKTSKGLEPII